MVKTAKLSDIRKRNAERRKRGLRAARRVNPDFVPGMRTFEKPRENPDKEKILKEMRNREFKLEHK